MVKEDRNKKMSQRVSRGPDPIGSRAPHERCSLASFGCYKKCKNYHRLSGSVGPSPFSQPVTLPMAWCSALRFPLSVHTRS